MYWNIDYDISAVVFLTMLIIYFKYRKCLPLASNRYFIKLLYASILIALTDILSSIALNIGNSIFSLYTINIITILYYLVLIYTPTLFSSYVATLVDVPIKSNLKLKAFIYHIPCYTLMIMTIFTPYNHTIFEITSDGVFYFGSLRILVYLETIFYLLFTALLLVIRRSYVRKSIFYSILLYIIFSVFGQTYQYFAAPYTQTLSLAASAGLLLIFLVFQNPDYERDRTTGMYRDLGLQKIKNEDALYNINRPVIGLGFENFYSLRSLYGDETFDIIFSKVTKYLRTIMPEYYIFYCRNGNFLAFYDGNIDRVQELKKEILSRFSGPFKSENEDVYLSPIFIYSTSDVPMESLEIFYNSIHLAFDTAIAIGKGGVCQITNEIHDKAVRNVKVEKALKKALHNNSLLVYYQPIYSTLKGKICSAEALVRLYDDELGILYPDEFIWRAEANGSVLTLGEQVFRKVCEFVSQQDMEKLGLEFIDVNLSPLQCMRRQLAEEFETIMKEYHIDPKYINLEITETASTDIKVIKDNMNQLCDQGVTFALDDYGSGFSNLINVLSLPLSIIKIDKSIVWAYFNDGNDLLLRVIQTFENKNLHLVVEGVETEEMAKKLAELGCHYEQGYFYSKPIPEVDFLNYLKQNKH